jgi:hypothetical protein
VTVSRGYREPVCFDAEINIQNGRKRQFSALVLSRGGD